MILINTPVLALDTGQRTSPTYSTPQIDWLMMQPLVGSGQVAVSTPTIAGLRALPVDNATAGMVVQVTGYDAVRDEGGGAFIWTPTSTVEENACTAIKPKAISGAGRWLRSLQNGAILPAAACGVSAASNDNTAALQAAFAACKGRGVEGKPVCAVELPAGDLRHTGLTLDRGLQVRANPRGSTLLAVSGITVPGLTVACAHDGFDYYAAGAPPCKVDLTNVVLKHINKNDKPGRDKSHGLVLTDAEKNPIYTVVTADNLEIYSAPGDGLTSTAWKGFATINRLYINGSFRHNLHLNSIYDWRLINVDLIYGGQDNAVLSSVGGLNIFGLKSYNAVRYGLNIYGAGSSPGQNYIFGLAVDNNGQHGIYYNEQGGPWLISGGNIATNSRSAARSYSDIFIDAAANSRLSIAGQFYFPTPTTSKFAIEFGGSNNTVSAFDTVFQGGNPIAANKWSNNPAQTIGKGAQVSFDGGIRMTGVSPIIRIDDSKNNSQFLNIMLNSGVTALYDTQQARNILVIDAKGRLMTYGLNALNYPSSAVGLPRGAVYRDPDSLTLKYVP